MSNKKITIKSDVIAKWRKMCDENEHSKMYCEIATHFEMAFCRMKKCISNERRAFTAIANQFGNLLAKHEAQGCLTVEQVEQRYNLSCALYMLIDCVATPECAAKIKSI